MHHHRSIVGNAYVTAPLVNPLRDDEQRACAVLDDVLRVCRVHRIGLFARNSPGLHIAIADPVGATGRQPLRADQMKLDGTALRYMDASGSLVRPEWDAHSISEAPFARQLVVRWYDFADVDFLRDGVMVAWAQSKSAPGTPPDAILNRSGRTAGIIDALGQVMRHWDAAITPFNFSDGPQMVLCEVQPPAAHGQRQLRAYSVVTVMDAYGYVPYPVKTKRTN